MYDLNKQWLYHFVKAVHIRVYDNGLSKTNSDNSIDIMNLKGERVKISESKSKVLMLCVFICEERLAK